MEFSCAVAIMEKIGGWEKRKENENQIGARFGVCMWIYSKAAISQRSNDMWNFMSKLHSITEAINKTWDCLHGAHERLQNSSVEL